MNNGENLSIANTVKIIIFGDHLPFHRFTLVSTVVALLIC